MHLLCIATHTIECLHTTCKHTPKPKCYTCIHQSAAFVSPIDMCAIVITHIYMNIYTASFSKSNQSSFLTPIMLHYICIFNNELHVIFIICSCSIGSFKWFVGSIKWLQGWSQLFMAFVLIFLKFGTNRETISLTRKKQSIYLKN